MEEERHRKTQKELRVALKDIEEISTSLKIFFMSQYCFNGRIILFLLSCYFTKIRLNLYGKKIYIFLKEIKTFVYLVL